MSHSSYYVTVKCPIGSKTTMLALLKKQLEQAVEKDFQEIQHAEHTRSKPLYTPFGKYTICWDPKTDKHSCTCPHYQYRCASRGTNCKHIAMHTAHGH
uniref:SWIM-type domain-containing protein n=1 Tax=viral metagenome TaxID=1070528 RepID=A0A6C0KDA8_9ZZZZ